MVKHYNGAHKFSCVVGIVAMCSYSEISTCGRPRPRRLGLNLGLVVWPQPWPQSFGLGLGLI